MRGAGDARRSLLVMCVVNGLNVVASWTLLNGVPGLGIPALGVVGSAMGAAAGWALGAGLAVFLLTRPHARSPRLVWDSLRPQRDVAERVLRVGLPSAAELVVFQVGVLAFNRDVVSLGSAAYAANITINTVENLGTLPGFGFAVVATALVGQALGAGDPDLAERSAWTSFRLCFALTISVGLMALLAPHLMLGLFVADSGVLAAGGFAMRLSIITLPASAAAAVFNGALRGAGDTKFPVLVRGVGTWGLRLPLAALLIPLWALPGARASQAIDWVTQAGITYWRFRSGRWRHTRV